MNGTHSSGSHLVDAVLWIWFSLTAVSVAYVAYDQFKGGLTKQMDSVAMKTMRWGWVLITLYTGVFALAAYCFTHRAVTGEKRVPPIWIQSVESTIHCVAGDATGILLATVVTIWLRLPMSKEVVIEYVAGFAVGLLVFQALCMKPSVGGNYWGVVKSTVLPEMLSMNALMAGMIPVMVILMSWNMSAMEPNSIGFWGTMSLGFVIGTATTYPINVWLVKSGLKHGMGGEERARRLRHTTSASSKLGATVITLAMLLTGVALAANSGDLSMRAGDRRMESDSAQYRDSANPRL